MSKLLMQLQELDVYDDWMDAELFEEFEIDAEDASTGIAVSGDLSEVCCTVLSIFAMTVHSSSTTLSVICRIPVHVLRRVESRFG